MPVDRRLRDELAHVLAAQMRDRTGGDDLLARLRSLHEQVAPVDSDAAALADDVMLDLECNGARDTLDSLQSWDGYRRRIAFLLSDLPLPPRETLPNLIVPHERTLARALLAAMILSLAIAPWTKGVPFFACWIISPAIWLIATNKTLRSSSAVWPFASDEQWRAYERRLQSFHLPAWESSPHYCWRRMLSASATKVLLFGAVYLLTGLVWPLSVIAMSFTRDANAEPRGRVATR